MKKLVALLMVFVCYTVFSAEYIDGVTQEIQKLGIAGGQTIRGGTAVTNRLNLRGNGVNLTSGGITILDTTTATSATSGALIISGDTGSSGDIYVARGKYIKAPRAFDDTYYSILGIPTSGNNIELNIPGNGTGNAFNIKNSSATSVFSITGLGVVGISATTAATTSTSGALVIGGGVGISGDVVIATGKGLKNGTVQVVGARQTGFTAMTGTATKTAIDTDTALLQDIARRLKAIDDALRAHGLID